jgi:hypothetical protein
VPVLSTSSNKIRFSLCLVSVTGFIRGFDPCAFEVFDELADGSCVSDLFRDCCDFDSDISMEWRESRQADVRSSGSSSEKR